MVSAAISVVVRTEINHSPQADVRFYPAHVQIFEVTATVQIGFEVNTIAATVYLAILDKDVPYATGHFTTDGNGPPGEVAVTDNHIFRGLADAPAVLVAS